MRTDTGQVFHLEDYKPTDFLIPETHLDFSLHPERTVVKSTLQIERREGVASDAPLILDGDDLKLVDIRLDGAVLGDNAYVATPDRLEIRGLPENGAFTLEITTEINPTTNRQLTGLYRSSDVYCTQCEAEGFRRITDFLDRPDMLPRATRCASKPNVAKHHCYCRMATPKIRADLPTAVILPSGTIRIRSQRICSRLSPAILA